MAKPKILVVDDEENILELVRYNLSEEGYAVETAASGEQALASARKFKPDLMVLDLMLPDIDGLNVCGQMRSDPRTRTVPIIMLTAKGQEADIVAGIECGADDYIAKPFSPSVLCARVGMVLRRTTKTGGAVNGENDSLKLKGLAIDPDNHEVLVRGRPVSLTSTEFRIIHFLARSPGRVFTRNQLVEAVHGEEGPVTERSIDVRMFGLRKKLGRLASHYIETVRGIGYRLRA